MAAMEKCSRQPCRREMGYDYLACRPGEKSAGRSSRFRRVRFLCLVRVPDSRGALRELSLPLSVLLSTPRRGLWRLLRALAAPHAASAFSPSYMVQIEKRRFTPNRSGQLIGLPPKNAILIVEFRKGEFEKGKPLADALWKARASAPSHSYDLLRFHPRLRSLWTASGAGSVARQIMALRNRGHAAASALGIFSFPPSLHCRTPRTGKNRPRRIPSTASRERR